MNNIFAATRGERVETTVPSTTVSTFCHSTFWKQQLYGMFQSKPDLFRMLPFPKRGTGHPTNSESDTWLQYLSLYSTNPRSCDSVSIEIPVTACPLKSSIDWVAESFLLSHDIRMLFQWESLGSPSSHWRWNLSFVAIELTIDFFQGGADRFALLRRKHFQPHIAELSTSLSVVFWRRPAKQWIDE